MYLNGTQILGLKDSSYGVAPKNVVYKASSWVFAKKVHGGEVHMLNV